MHLVAAAHYRFIRIEKRTKVCNEMGKTHKNEGSASRHMYIYICMCVYVLPRRTTCMQKYIQIEQPQIQNIVQLMHTQRVRERARDSQREREREGNAYTHTVDQ